MAISYASPTNLREHAMLQRDNLSVIEQILMRNDKVALLAAYDELIVALQADRATANSTTNVNTLIQ